MGPIRRARASPAAFWRRLAELFLALEASQAVVARYEAEVGRVGVGTVIEHLVHLVASVALAEQVAESVALADVQPPGSAVESIDNRLLEQLQPFGAELSQHDR